MWGIVAERASLEEALDISMRSGLGDSARIPGKCGHSRHKFKFGATSFPTTPRGAAARPPCTVAVCAAWFVCLVCLAALPRALRCYGRGFGRTAPWFGSSADGGASDNVLKVGNHAGSAAAGGQLRIGRAAVRSGVEAPQLPQRLQQSASLVGRTSGGARCDSALHTGTTKASPCFRSRGAQVAVGREAGTGRSRLGGQSGPS
jgi:hypothetical protein